MTFVTCMCVTIIRVGNVLISEQESKSEPPPDPAPGTNSQSEPGSGDLETDKKMKNLKKVRSRTGHMT